MDDLDRLSTLPKSTTSRVPASAASKVAGRDKERELKLDVKSGDVGVRMTLMPAHLKKSMRTSVILPFLKVYNKKKKTSFDAKDVVKVFLAGTLLSEDALGFPLDARLVLRTTGVAVIKIMLPEHGPKKRLPEDCGPGFNPTLMSGGQVMSAAGFAQKAAKSQEDRQVKAPPVRGRKLTPEEEEAEEKRRLEGREKAAAEEERLQREREDEERQRIREAEIAAMEAADMPAARLAKAETDVKELMTELARVKGVLMAAKGMGASIPKEAQARRAAEALEAAEAWAKQEAARAAAAEAAAAAEYASEEVAQATGEAKLNAELAAELARSGVMAAAHYAAAADKAAAAERKMKEAAAAAAAPPAEKTAEEKKQEEWVSSGSRYLLHTASRRAAAAFAAVGEVESSMDMVASHPAWLDEMSGDDRDPTRKGRQAIHYAAYSGAAQGSPRSL